VRPFCFYVRTYSHDLQVRIVAPVTQSYSSTSSGSVTPYRLIEYKSPLPFSARKAKPKNPRRNTQTLSLEIMLSTKGVMKSSQVLLVCFVILAVLSAAAVSAFSSSSSTTTSKQSTALFASEVLSSKTEDFVNVSTSIFSPTDWLRSQTKSNKCRRCPDDDELFELEEQDKANNGNGKDGFHPSQLLPEDKDMDRREAAFAMLGTLWATATATTTMTAFPQSSEAAYGQDAKIEMPNMLQGLNDRATKQCLVESLGNRECLVYMDPDNQLFQGLDAQKLLQRIDTSSVALTKIPAYVEAKQWSKVSSILTGPMGELMVTMNQLAPLSTKQPEKSISLAKQVKLNVFAIGAAADKKDGKAILKSTQAATDSLVKFVESL
jgi:hypothetical protein